MGGTMSPLALVLLPTLSEGPLARVELSFPREDAATRGPLVEGMVEALGARLRRNQRVLDAGIRVDAGCSRSRCVVALDGLASGVDAALPALAEAVAGPPVRIATTTKKVLRRRWRQAWRVPVRLLDAGLNALSTGSVPQGMAGERPQFGAQEQHHAALQVTAPGAWVELAAAGAYDEPSMRSFANGLTPAEVRATPLPAVAVVTQPAILVIDWPNAERTQIGVSWGHSEGDDVRERLLAGDFHSLLVQRLREAETFTYDVTPEFGDGWAGASFDVARDAAVPSMVATMEELRNVERLDAHLIAGATLRLQANMAALDDTLVGRLALRWLPEPPKAPPITLAPPRLIGFVLVGDAASLEAPLRAAFPELTLSVVSGCRLMYARDSPPGCCS